MPRAFGHPINHVLLRLSPHASIRLLPFLIIKVVQAISRAFDMDTENSSFFSSLTRREQEILLLSIQGLSCKSAARELQISHLTLHKHRQNIYRKLGSSSLAEITHLARLSDFGFRIAHTQS